MKQKTWVFLFSALFAALVGCSKEATPIQYDCTGLTPTYTANVKSILDTHCAYAGCHGGSNPQKGIDLSTYTKAKDESLNGSVVGSIQHLKGYDPMPDGSAKLDEATIKLVSCWVQNGAPE